MYLISSFHLLLEENDTIVVGECAIFLYTWGNQNDKHLVQRNFNHNMSVLFHSNNINHNIVIFALNEVFDI